MGAWYAMRHGLPLTLGARGSMRYFGVHLRSAAARPRPEIRLDTYYHPHDLGKFADMGKGNTDLWDKFMVYYGAVFAEGALTAREKALIALGVSHAVQCPYCIDAYTQASLQQGSNLEEMTEVAHVACAIRGGASLVHGVQMRNVAEKLSM
jgi:4-carboxymuconolactone decarboxylase